MPLSYINRLVPAYVRNEPPYCIIAGLVFTVLTEPYLQSEYGEEWIDDTPVGLMDKLLYGMQEVSRATDDLLPSAVCKYLSIA